jgi:hypothetical protein
MANLLAGIGGALSGLAGGLQQQRENQMQLVLMRAALAQQGIMPGATPSGASVTPDLTSANAPPLLSSLTSGQSTGLPMVAPNPVTTNSSLLNPNPMADPATMAAAVPSGPPLGADAGASRPLSRISVGGAPAAPGDTSVLTALRNARAQTVGQPIVTPTAPTDQSSVITAMRQAAGPRGVSIGDPIPGLPPRGASMLSVLNSAAAQQPQTGGAPSDADVAAARGTINGQINFNNPVITDPLTGQPTSRYADLGGGYHQDVLASPAAEKLKLDQMATDRMLAAWGIRGQSNVDRATITAGAHVQGIDAQQGGATARSDNTIAARTATTQARIDAQERTAAANRAEGMQQFLTARTPTTQQRAQLTLSTYDKLRLQAKDPITGEYSADPDELWDTAQTLVSKAIPTPGKSGGPAPTAPSTGQSAAPRSTPTSAAPTATGFSGATASAIQAENQKATAALRSLDPTDPQFVQKQRAIAGTLNQRTAAIAGQ